MYISKGRFLIIIKQINELFNEHLNEFNYRKYLFFLDINF